MKNEGFDVALRKTFHMRLPFVFFQDIAGKGRGVFTSQEISAESIVEIAPVIVMPAEDRGFLDRTLLHDYIFEWQLNCCMALGYVPLYNHSYESNCEYFMDYEEETIMIKTVRKVAAGEELTINYNGDWDNSKKVWFEVK